MRFTSNRNNNRCTNTMIHTSCHLRKLFSEVSIPWLHQEPVVTGKSGLARLSNRERVTIRALMMLCRAWVHVRAKRWATLISSHWLQTLSQLRSQMTTPYKAAKLPTRFTGSQSCLTKPVIRKNTSHNRLSIPLSSSEAGSGKEAAPCNALASSTRTNPSMSALMSSSALSRTLASLPRTRTKLSQWIWWSKALSVSVSKAKGRQTFT